MTTMESIALLTLVLAAALSFGWCGYLIGFSRGQLDEQRRIRKRIEKGVRTFRETTPRLTLRDGVTHRPMYRDEKAEAAMSAIEAALELNKRGGQ